MNRKPTIQLLGSFLVGVVLTVIVAHVYIVENREHKHVIVSGINYITQDNLKFRFIHPLLDVEYINEEDSMRQFPYMKRIHNDVQDEVNKYPDIKIGVYFNDLGNAGWVGVNQTEKFIPASLLKLPMLISYYKLRENEPNLFDQQISYTGNDFNSLRNTNDASPITPGHIYSIQELLRAMIVDSDNNALELLYQYKKDALKEVFDDLGTPLPDNRNDIAMQDFLTPEAMAKFFLVLYNGSYLKKTDSEEALQLLSEVKFKDGIVAGIPSDVIVSHKYGERKVNVGNGNSENELHDCGIVYWPKGPYQLCIMTRGKSLNLDSASKIISSISKIVYEGVIAGK